jgi:uncharacterized protein YndB with AHSA1/START domain
MKEANMATMKPVLEVRIERLIAAPPSRVYRAWLEPELLRRWLAPGSMEVARVEVDERVGGYVRIWQTHNGQDAGGFECRLIELVPDQRIVFRWGFVGPQRTKGPTFDSLLTITLQASPGNSTALTLVHERLDDLERAMPDVARNVGIGWETVFDKLAKLLDRVQQ